MTFEELDRLKAIANRSSASESREFNFYEDIIMSLTRLKEDYPSAELPWDAWIEQAEERQRDRREEALKKFSEIRIDFGDSA